MQRINYAQQSPDLLKGFVAFNNAIKESTIEQSTLDLVTLRASQLNGCGFCVDMHVKEAKIHGERELRLQHVAVWRESIVAINGWNRLSVAFKSVPGSADALYGLDKAGLK